MSQIDNVSIVKRANIYFDGKCISHTVLLPDGGKKTLGVILPSCLEFRTGAPETMEIVAGRCRVIIDDQNNWVSYCAGQSFEVPASTRFTIETTEMLDYVCHFHE